MTHNEDLPFFAMLNPQCDQWEVIPYPKAVRSGFTEVLSNALYLISSGGLHRYDLNTRQWGKLEIPAQKLSHLFAVNGRLYTANDENICEILADGKGILVLASCRRRPAISVLDSKESLGDVKLFPGPNHSLCTRVGNSLYKWDGRDWKEMFTLPDLETPLILDGATLLLSAPYMGTAELWLLPYGRGVPELCLRDGWRDITGWMHIRPPAVWADARPRPTWLAPCGSLSLSQPRRCSMAPVATFGSNLCFVVDHICTIHQPEIARPYGWRNEEKDGRQASLVFLDRDSPRPLIIPLRFDIIKDNWFEMDQMRTWNDAVAWIVNTTDSLVICQYGARGMWIIPHAEIAAALDRQKNVKH